VLIFDGERSSDSPFVERIWSCHSEAAGSFDSIAESRWEMVLTNHAGTVHVTVRGPETRATQQRYPAGDEWLGIRFKLGTVMPHLPASRLVDAAVTLPPAARRSFWLNGSALPLPDYENAEALVDRLVREDLLVREPAVSAALRGRSEDLSLRSVQRRFLRTAGVTHTAARQIERARYAALLLKQGVPILDTVHQAGYFDQPHMTRSMRYFIGRTPAEVGGRSRPAQLSYLYKTTPFR
jgi:AraC-like DNA-binding protein